MNEQRLIDLEIRYSHQEEFLQQLNQVVIDQQLKIERLEKELLDLKRGPLSENDLGEKRNLSEEKPPHY